MPKRWCEMIGICELKIRTWADVTCIDIFFREYKIMFLDYFGDKNMSHLCRPKT